MRLDSLIDDTDRKPKAKKSVRDDENVSSIVITEYQNSEIIAEVALVSSGMSHSDRKAEGDRAVAAREAAGSAPGRARTTRGVWTAGSIDTQQTIFFYQTNKTPGRF